MTQSDQSDVTPEMIERGARALTQGGPSAVRPVGDVLHDYDWTPIEASEAVLRAALGRVAFDEERP